jgi:hypothetical protein
MEELEGQRSKVFRDEKPTEPAFLWVALGAGVWCFLLRMIASLMAGEKNLMMMVGGAGGSEGAPGVDEVLGLCQDLVL